ncbi:uncharacterized protein MONOS_14863 [Monocercomonoides exilis]|uniref:uncharacterized protein n=1 Tax=Monocercomonoides exilis TaxID=2049356 RepID=UPI0035594928|nr:hypothetical protein MONOS_14863 [Monocercomonoides exilis]|eukprot:MONOS_14863.1-p1 / transcript=MONOS_14863.1 / gene=MONOS_14863 / organism=Monocercomonoides_exilis_PA203 / gene_product=unspecified product / transcript_product=unspecified product / location=Mono_scaffold01089:2344-3335(-) / protein_length=309 / sequence_SO=supercontig / SO=protein_coding / is_pseudo=false
MISTPIFESNHIQGAQSEGQYENKFSETKKQAEQQLVQLQPECGSDLKECNCHQTVSEITTDHHSLAKLQIVPLQQFSRSVMNDHYLTRIVKWLCIQFQSVLSQPLPSEYPNEKLFQEASYLRFAQLYRKINHFFQAVRTAAYLNVAELVHVVYLIDLLIQSERMSRREKWTGVITEANLGTLLLIAVMTSVKMNRDTPYRNGWWSAAIGIPISIINQSEIVFLQRIHYTLVLEYKQYMKIVTELLRVYPVDESELEEYSMRTHSQTLSHIKSTAPTSKKTHTIISSDNSLAISSLQRCPETATCNVTA